jgi:hypothetical protein
VARRQRLEQKQRDTLYRTVWSADGQESAEKHWRPHRERTLLLHQLARFHGRGLNVRVPHHQVGPRRNASLEQMHMSPKIHNRNLNIGVLHNPRDVKFDFLPAQRSMGERRYAVEMEQHDVLAHDIAVGRIRRLDVLQQ